jgi:hypothetical protein
MPPNNGRRRSSANRRDKRELREAKLQVLVSKKRVHLIEEKIKKLEREQFEDDVITLIRGLLTLTPRRWYEAKEYLPEVFDADLCADIIETLEEQRSLKRYDEFIEDDEERLEREEWENNREMVD